MKYVLGVNICFLLIVSLVRAQDLPAKENKEEVQYKGKPAGFWIKQLKDRDVSFRLDAVKALREIGTDGDGVVVALVQTLTDKEPIVGDAARSALVALPLEKRLPALVQILRGKEKSARAATIDLLGETGSKAKDAIPDLAKALDDGDPNIRSRAANAIGRIGSPDTAAMTGLVKLIDDKDTSVRQQAVKTLKGVSLAEKLPTLIAALKDGSAVIRVFAVGELEEVGPDAKAAVPALIPLLQEMPVRLSAVRALGKIGPEARTAIPELTRLLDDNDEAMRTAALTALRNLGPDARLPILVQSLKDKTPQVRVEAAKALAKFGSDGKVVIPALASALRDPDPLVCNEVASALREMGKEGLPPLVEFLKGTSKNRPIAAIAVGEFGLDAKEAIPVLLNFLDEEDEVLQSAATTALRKMGPTALFPALLGSLKDRNWEVRMKAASALGTMGAEAKSAIPVLVTAFAKAHTFHDGRMHYEGRSLHEGWKVYEAYSSALRRIGAHGVPLLVETLKKHKDNSLVVAIVTSTLADIGLPDAAAAVPILVELQKEEKCRVSAILALGQLGSPDAMPGIPALLEIVEGHDSFRIHNLYLKSRLAAEALIRQCDREVRPRLPRMAEREQMLFARREAIDRRIALQALADDGLIREGMSEFVRRSAVLELKARGKEAVPPLLKILRSESKYRPLAALLLVELRPQEAKEATAILAELSQNAKTHRAVYAYALGRIGGPNARVAVPLLVDLLRDEDLVSEDAVAALRKLGKDAVPTLIEFLKEKNERKVLAMGALGEIGPDAKAAMPILLQLLQDEDWRTAAALAIGNIGGPDAKPAVPILAKLFDDGDEHMQRAAATALGKVGEAAVPTLQELLKPNGERDDDRCFLAAYALGEIGPDAKAAIPALVKLLDDDDKVVRMTAATALGKLGKNAVSPLMEYLERKDQEDRMVQRPLAIHALGEIGPDAKKAVPVLLRLMEKAGEARLDELKKAKDLRARQARTFVFLRPSLLKVKTYADLLEADCDLDLSAALALAKIDGPNSRDAIAVLVDILDPNRARKKDFARELKQVGREDARALRHVSGIGPVLRAVRQDPKDDEESRNEQSADKQDKERGLLEQAVINALKAIGKDAAPPLVASLKKRGAWPTAMALARISPDDAKGLAFSIFHRERLSSDNQDTKITDVELGELAPFKNLAGLNLDRSKVTDAGMKVLPNFNSLSNLSLDSTRVTNGGLKEIARLKNLEILELGGTMISDAGLKDIARLKSLTVLDLGSTMITDVGLSELAILPNLSTLGLAHTGVTDVGLKNLASFKNLSLLDLRGTQVTQAGVEALRKALPGAVIHK